MSLSTVRLQEILNQLAASGVADSTDVINAVAELVAIAGGGDTSSTDIAALQAKEWVTSTTTALADVTAAINTGANKVAGYMVFNTTTGAPVWATGNADADVWNDATGTTAHSPV